MQVTDGEELTWEHVIQHARKRGTCQNLVPEDGGPIADGMRPLPMAHVAPGVVQLREGVNPKAKNIRNAQPNCWAHSDPTMNNRETEEAKDCELCVDLDRPEAAKTHPLDKCFTNPKSQLFKENVWKLRIRELKRKNLKVPKLMQKEEVPQGPEG